MATPTKSLLGLKDSNDADYVLDLDAFGTHAVLGATMTISPEAAAESGYIRVSIAGTVYQMAIYAE